MKLYLKYFFGIWLLVLLCFFLPNCKKTIVCLDCDECMDFPEESDGVNYINVYDSVERRAPCYNPNDNNEFIFQKVIAGKYSLVKGYINSKKEIVLLSNIKKFGQPKWGKNGWIVFSDHQINIIREDGTKHSKITSSYYYLYPNWKNDSTISSQFSFNLAIPSFYCELNMKGEIIDTVRNGNFTLGCINRQNEAAYLTYRDDPNITIRSLSTNSILFKTNYNWDFRIQGIDWNMNNNDLYFSTIGDGLYKIAKNAKEHNRVRKGCDSKSYNYLSISPDGKNLLVEITDISYLNKTKGELKVKVDIWIMDLETKQERKVF